MSYIKGYIYDRSGNIAPNASVTFTNTTAAVVIVNHGMVTQPTVTVRCNSSGYFYVALAMGDYRVTSNGNVDRVDITVPDDALEYWLDDVTGEAVYSAQASPGVKYSLTALTSAALKALPSKNTNEVAFLLGDVAIGDGLGNAGTYGWIATPGVRVTVDVIDTTTAFYIPNDSASCSLSNCGYWRKGF